ncbi:MAG: GNAT family N-acetyltransferase [Pseudobutyrivibrio sp.]|nr:GNAT family N-acetyltransferase [Pseudobutyrivibrio sp.]
MAVQYEQATKEDIKELIRLRMAYLYEDFGELSSQEATSIEAKLQDYFSRRLGEELIAFIARDGERIVSQAYLHIAEIPASPVAITGLVGEVFSVYTEPGYRGQGICSKLIDQLIDYGKAKGLSRIDLFATDDGYSIYKKAGFADKITKYADMRYVYTCE